MDTLRTFSEMVLAMTVGLTLSRFLEKWIRGLWVGVQDCMDRIWIMLEKENK